MEQQLDSHADPDLPGKPIDNLVHGWISVPEVVQLFLEAGLPRNERTIRRYCMRGDLDCRKTENALHQPQYFIDPKSAEIYIEQQRSLPTSAPDVSDFARTGQEGASNDLSGMEAETMDLRALARAGHDQTVPGVPGQDRTVMSQQLVDQLEQRLADKDQEIVFLRGELQHRRTTDQALHDVILAFRANAEAQRLSSGLRDNKKQRTGEWSFGEGSDRDNGLGDEDKT